MTTKTLFSTKFTVKPPIFGAGRSKLDHRFSTEKYLEERNPLYIPQPIDLMRGLVLWLNDQGKSAATWKDMTPGGTNDGTIFGAGTPPSATPGALGYTFDGIDDYVTALQYNTTNPITMSVWFKYNTPSLTQRIITFGDGSTSIRQYIGIENTANKLQMRLRGGTITTYNAVLTQVTWYHAVLTYNGTTGNAYLNNVDLGDLPVGTRTDNINLYFGATPLGAPYFNGSIADVRIYNRGLSEGERTSLFNLERGKYGV